MPVSMFATNLIGIIAANESSSKWSVTNLLSGAAANLKLWGSLIIFILGLAAIIVAIYKTVTGLASHGQKQTSWAVVIILFILGGVLTAGGATSAWGFVAGTVAGGGKETLNDMGTKGGNNNPGVEVDNSSTVIFMPEV